jgi:hypothetical protein
MQQSMTQSMVVLVVLVVLVIDAQLTPLVTHLL